MSTIEDPLVADDDDHSQQIHGATGLDLAASMEAGALGAGLLRPVMRRRSVVSMRPMP